MSEAREILKDYLRRIGLTRPADVAQRVQITLLEQWCDHLADVLEAETPPIPGDQRARIIRAVIYGGAPTLAEQEIRQEMTREMSQMAERTIPPPVPLPPDSAPVVKRMMDGWH
jgi:hypothetical protein